MINNKVIYESILDDEEIIMSLKKTVKDLIADAHKNLIPDDEFQYMLIISFEVWTGSSYIFIKPDKPEDDDNKFPIGSFCQILNEILDYNMFLSKYQMSRVIVNDYSMSVYQDGNKNRIDYEIEIEDPLKNPEYVFNIVDEYRAIGGLKFLGLRPVFNIYIPFIPPKKLPFMRMCNSIYQLCRQIKERLGGFALDISSNFELKWKTIHPTEWSNLPYNFSSMNTTYCKNAEYYKKIYKRIYGEDVQVNPSHDIMRYKIIRNTDLWQYARHAAEACTPLDGVIMTVTNIFQPDFDTNRYSSIDPYLLNKATRRTIPRVVGFEVNPGSKKEVDINTLEEIFANDFILKLPDDYCNSCLLTICVKCNVNLKNNVHTSETMRDALKEEIRDRQGGYGRLYDWVGNRNNKWVFNPCTKDQVKVENTDCYNCTNGKRGEIWRVVDMKGKDTPEIRVFFCDKNGCVNRAPITEVNYFGEEYRILMHTINDLMDSGVIWDKDYDFSKMYNKRSTFGLW